MLDRDALYYPYINVQDVNWLKATLLCFPQVRRMVPPGFDINDTKEIESFYRTNGPRGPLLFTEYTNQPSANQAQEVLFAKIASQEDVLIKKYSLTATQAEVGN